MAGIQDVLDGALGVFWLTDTDSYPDPDSSTERPGFLQQEEGAVRLHLVAEDRGHMHGWGTHPMPTAIRGATDHSGVLLLDLVGVRGTNRYGGGRISSERFTAQTLIASPSALDVTSVHLTEIAATFSGAAMLRWADLESIEQDTDFDERSRVQAVTIRLRSSPNLAVRLSGSRELRVSAYWHTREDPDLGHVIRTSLEISTSSRSPRKSRDLLEPVVRCQELLGIAFGGLVVADSGRAALPGQEDRSYMWNTVLMAATVDQEARRRESNPMFRLQDIGGVRALRRWVNLTAEHPRATAPLQRALRMGHRYPAVQILELATAIEYWVAAHRRTDAWAQQGDNFAEAVALHVGSAFANWIKRPKDWATLFWDRYNAMKHEPSFIPDLQELWLLVQSAQLLLTAELLNGIARNKAPGRAIFSHYTNVGLGTALGELLGEPAVTP